MLADFRFHRWSLLGLLWLCAVAAVAEAGTGDRVSLPQPGKRIRHKARAEVESYWVIGSGYRPVKVTIFNHPGGPTLYDRDFRVRLRPLGYSQEGYPVSVEAIVDMPEGATSGSATIPVPQAAFWYQMQVEIFEGGQRIDELSEAFTITPGGYGGQASYWYESSPSVLVIDSDVPLRQQRDLAIRRLRSAGNDPEPTHNLPDIRHWQSLLPSDMSVSSGIGMPSATTPGVEFPISDLQLLSLAADHGKIELLPPQELPESWLHYTCFDLVLISLSEAQDLATSSPERWQAILDWTASGPTLIVNGLGEDFERRGDLEKLLGVPASEINDGTGTPLGLWRPASSEHALQYVQIFQNQRNRYINPDEEDSLKLSRIQRPLDAPPPFAIRRFGLGRVAMMAADEALGNPPHDMAWLLNQLHASTWTHYQRHGFSHSRPNNDFVTFLIEGTGRVPVYTFLVLISLFTVVIGPVNYYLLLRWRRLYLLLVTVPASALVVTLGLFAYAILSDGLGVQLRARSYARLDQQTGRISTMARQTYYAGLAPSGGLTFPLDTAVYPIDERPPGQNSGQMRQLSIGDDAQQLRSGYLRSRQTAQFLLVQSSRSEAKLEILPPATPGGPPRIVNRLGTTIEELLICDEQGRHFAAREVAPEAEAALLPATLPDALKPFAKVFGERRMEAPGNYIESHRAGNLWGFNNPYYYDHYYYNQQQTGLPDPSYSASLLEAELRRAMISGGTSLVPRSYLALVKSAPHMPVGYKRVQERGSLHLLEGTW